MPVDLDENFSFEILLKLCEMEYRLSTYLCLSSFIALHSIRMPDNVTTYQLLQT